MHCPDDEYDSEVEDILELIPSAKSVQELAEKIRAVFVKWFDEKIAGPYEVYLRIAELIWAKKNRFD